MVCFFFSSRRRHTILVSDWSSDVCSSDLDGRSPAAETKGVTLTTSVPAAGDRPSAEERSVVVHADRTRLEQVRSEERRVGRESSALLWEHILNTHSCFKNSNSVRYTNVRH